MDTKSGSNLCPICDMTVFVKIHGFVHFPCEHVFHSACLISENIPKEIAHECPLCNKTVSKLNRLTSITLDTARSLGVSHCVRDVRGEARLELIHYIANRRYKHDLKKLKKKEKSNPKLKQENESNLLDWMPVAFLNRDGNDSNDDEENDLVTTEKTERLLKKCTRVDKLLMKGISFTVITTTGMDLSDLFNCGYNIIDFLILDAKWNELLEFGLTAKHFILFKSLIDINSLITYYKLDYKNIFIQLCDHSFDNMALLGLKFEDMKTINFNGDKLRKRGTEISMIKQSALYKTLGEQEWKALRF